MAESLNTSADLVTRLANDSPPVVTLQKNVTVPNKYIRTHSHTHTRKPPNAGDLRKGSNCLQTMGFTVSFSFLSVLCFISSSGKRAEETAPLEFSAQFFCPTRIAKTYARFLANISVSTSAGPRKPQEAKLCAVTFSSFGLIISGHVPCSLSLGQGSKLRDLCYSLGLSFDRVVLRETCK